MEEADVLATRVAIMSKRILAVGTTEYLCQKHGNAYHVHLVLTSAPTSTREEMNAVEQWAQRSFDGVRFDPYGNHHGQVRFSVSAVKRDDGPPDTDDRITPVDETGSGGGQGGIGAVLALLERERGRIGLQAFS